jgi:soluble lytic murein transglycosylase
MKKLLLVILSLIIISLLVVTFYGYINYKNYKKYSSFINNSAVEYNIDSLLIISIIKAESNFKFDAVSKKGAIGLMQIMPTTASDLVNNNPKYGAFKTSDLYNPQINIDLGTAYLQFLLKIFSNDTNLALSSYNAGIGNVLKWNQDSKIYDEDKILFKETKKYVKKINKIYKLLKIIKKYFGKK